MPVISCFPGGGGGDEELIQTLINTHNEDTAAHPALLEIAQGAAADAATALKAVYTLETPFAAVEMTYTGAAQTPLWANYNSTGMTVGGTLSATNAGEYTATFTPNEGYKWSDGTTAARDVTWRIEKAEGSVSVNPAGLTIAGPAGTTGTIAVTRLGDGAITATSSDTKIATVSVSGTTVTVTGVDTGSATIVISVAESTNYLGTSCTVEVTSVAIRTTLNDNAWATIRRASDCGLGANYWSIGDRKAVTLNGTVGKLSLSNVTIYAFIIGFNHNSELEGENRIHFQLAKTDVSGGTDVALCDSSYSLQVSSTGYFSMNSSKTNSGGWASSQMRRKICGTSLESYSGTIIAVIPAELRAVLKAVTKYTDNKGNSNASASAVTATTDYFFLLSEFEVSGSISEANSNESSKQAQYAYYSAGNSKIKYKHSATSTAAIWWLRSPRASNSYYFVLVVTGGTVNGDRADYSLGFAPGFCV